MKHQNDKEYLSGTIERITYHNADNGFCVIRVKVKGHKDLVTVTGNVPSISAGEYIKCSGIWHNDRNHGKQFKADSLKSLPPETLEGIERYLGSGLIKSRIYLEKVPIFAGRCIFAALWGTKALALSSALSLRVGFPSERRETRVDLASTQQGRVRDINPFSVFSWKTS